MLGVSWRGGSKGGGEEIRADTVKSIHDSLFLAAAHSSPPSLDVFLCTSSYLSASFPPFFLFSSLLLFFLGSHFHLQLFFPRFICSIRSFSVTSKAPSFLFTLSSFIRSINLFLLFPFSSLLSFISSSSTVNCIFLYHALSSPSSSYQSLFKNHTNLLLYTYCTGLAENSTQLSSKLNTSTQ